MAEDDRSGIDWAEIEKRDRERLASNFARSVIGYSFEPEDREWFVQEYPDIAEHIVRLGAAEDERLLRRVDEHHGLIANTKQLGQISQYTPPKQIESQGRSVEDSTIL